MKKKNDKCYKKYSKRLALLFAILVVVMMVVCVIQTFRALNYQILYDEAIKQGAENMVTALEMVVACSQLSNVTMEEIQLKVIEDYIKANKGGEK